MDVLNDVIGTSVAPHPETRDIDGATACADEIAIPDTHAFTTANPEEEGIDQPADTQTMGH